MTPFPMAKKLPAAKAHRITMRVACFIVKNLRPFSMVEDVEFREMVEEMEPRYKMPNRATFTEDLVPRMYEYVKTRVKKNCQKHTNYPSHATHGQADRRTVTSQLLPITSSPTGR